nr:MAG: putative RNA-dependent RNA polymerase [Narnaviridae sp.]
MVMAGHTECLPPNRTTLLPHLAQALTSEMVKGILRSVEDYLISNEISSPGSRQKPKMEKIKESLDRSTLISPSPDSQVRFLIDPFRIRKIIVSESLSQGERKKLLTLLKKRKLDEVVLALYQRGLPFVRLLGNGYGHYLQESHRFLHLLGLAEAVQVTMSSLSIRVRLPNPTRLSRITRRFELMFEAIFAHSPYSPKFLKGRRDPPIEELREKEKVVNRPRTTDCWYRMTVHYLHKFPSGLQEKEYVKLIKFNLAYRFSQETGQELPTGEKVIPLFPRCTHHALRNRFRLDRKGRTRFYKHLLECKSLCHPVSDDMVAEAYEKHYQSLCRPADKTLHVPDQLRRELFEYGQKVGQFLRKDYDPFKTVLPNRRATISRSRDKGGSLCDLKDHFQVVRGSTFKRHAVDRTPTPGSGEIPGVQSFDGVRPEPIVIGLFGPPGSGKSILVQRIISFFRGHFGIRDLSKLVYSRSCSSDHWDGYNYQPIVVMDDFGQNSFERKDVVEFENIVSCNRYVLPMADLSEKGREFRSPILIVTSNMTYGGRVQDATGGSVLADELALWRRFHLPFLVLQKGIYPFRRENLLQGDDENVQWTHLTQDVRPQKSLSSRYQTPGSSGLWQSDNRRSAEIMTDVADLLSREDLPNHKKVPRDLKERLSMKSTYLLNVSVFREEQQAVSDFIQQSKQHNDTWKDLVVRSFRLRKKLSIEEFYDHVMETASRRLEYHRYNLSDRWEQNIMEGTLSFRQAGSPFYACEAERGLYPARKDYVSTSVVFDPIPPFHQPRVEAVAIKEPLKVRMITKAEKEVRCLKPLQMSLFRYLKTQPQFALTHGVSWSDERTWDEKLEWIYRIEALIKGINDRSSSEDLWLSGDYTAATDNFPMSVTEALLEGILTGIDHEPTRKWARYELSPHRILYPNGKSGVQTSGQLMGSLLSFPLLCFLNDFIVRKSGFLPGHYLINGDDVVAKGPRDVIANWRRLAPQVGLSLSLGKNYIDPHFCCVNSQLFYDAEVQHTGKASTIVRRGRSLGACFSEAQFYYPGSVEIYSNFIRKNITLLRETPQSLYIPTHLGGLGYHFAPQSILDEVKVDWKLAKEVYLTHYLSKIGRTDSVAGFPFLRVVWVPTGFYDPELDPEPPPGMSQQDEYQLQSSMLESLVVNFEAEGHETYDLSFEELRRCRNLLSDHKELFNKLLGRSLRDYPRLGTLQLRPVYVQSGHAGWLKKRAISVALEGLIFGIDLNRERRSEKVRKKYSDFEVSLAECFLELEERHMDLMDSLNATIVATEKTEVLDTIPEEDFFPYDIDHPRDERGHLVLEERREIAPIQETINNPFRFRLPDDSNLLCYLPGEVDPTDPTTSMDQVTVHLPPPPPSLRPPPFSEGAIGTMPPTIEDQQSSMILSVDGTSGSSQEGPGEPHYVDQSGSLYREENSADGRTEAEIPTYEAHASEKRDERIFLSIEVYGRDGGLATRIENPDGAEEVGEILHDLCPFLDVPFCGNADCDPY